MHPGIVFVAGAAGVGKTTWIQQAFLEAGGEGVYGEIGSDSVAIDATYLASKIPGITIVPELTHAQLLQWMATPTLVLIELGFHVALDSPVLTQISGQRVAIVPPNTSNTEWHHWADQVVVGVEPEIEGQQLQIQRSQLTGEVFDPASLQTFWEELTQGAYGVVQRAKGIFDVVDGRAFYLNFVAGLPDTEYTELPVPQWLEGRPERFSGVEIVGREIDQVAITQTLQASCLSDQALAYYQAQIRESFAAV
jgi:hypothetical protein